MQVTDVIDGNPLGFELFSSLDDTPLASQAFFGVFSTTPTGDATYRFGSALTASIRGFTPDPVLDAGQSVLESATYTVTDANGLTDTALFSVRISRPAVTVINGTNGPDVIQAGFRDTVINGLGSDDVLIGGLGRDTLVGGDGDDRLLASPDDVLFAQNRANLDIFEGGSGNDEIRAGGGFHDIAVFSGLRADYTISARTDGFVVTDRNPADGDDGVDSLTGIELLQFADTLFAPELGQATFGRNVFLARVDGQVDAVLNPGIAVTLPPDVPTSMFVFNQTDEEPDLLHRADRRLAVAGLAQLRPDHL